MKNMDRVIELELTLLSGDRLYLCDRLFKVTSETRKNYDAKLIILARGLTALR